MAKRVNRPLLSARACAALALAAPVPVVIAPVPAHAQLSIGLDIRIGYAPPPMPVYEQPPLPAPDYIWVPGHWAWSDWIDDYYWVAGYWEQPPEPGLLWTPAWWGWDDGAFRFHGGYWGREVGWYGGIDYGYGYHGHGWEGGHWEGGHLAYNRAAVNITNVRVTNVYYQPTTVINNNGPRTSYSGGAGGVQARPTPQELRATQAPHIAPTPAQQQRAQAAASNPRNVASQITPNWHPAAVHRVGSDGTPIPRAVALKTGAATAGAPPQYQHPAPGMAPGQTGARPGNTYAAPARPAATAPGAAPRPAWQNQAAPGYQQPQRPTLPRQAPTPGYAATPRPAPAPGYAPPPRQAPAPGAYHPPAPQPQYHPAPPAPHQAPPPAPRPAPPPKPQPQPHDHEHEHP